MLHGLSFWTKWQEVGSPCATRFISTQSDADNSLKFDSGFPTYFDNLPMAHVQAIAQPAEAIYTDASAFYQHVQPPRPYSLLGFTTVVLDLLITPSADTPWAIFDSHKCDENKIFNLNNAAGERCGVLLLDSINSCAGGSNEPWSGLFALIGQYRIASRIGDKFVVLHMRRVDGVMERLGIGEVYESCFRNPFRPGPRWDTILLA